MTTPVINYLVQLVHYEHILLLDYTNVNNFVLLGNCYFISSVQLNAVKLVYSFHNNSFSKYSCSCFETKRSIYIKFLGVYILHKVCIAIKGLPILD